MDEKRIKQIFDDLDSDKDGKLMAEDFVEFMGDEAEAIRVLEEMTDGDVDAEYVTYTQFSKAFNAMNAAKNRRNSVSISESRMEDIDEIRREIMLDAKLSSQQEYVAGTHDRVVSMSSLSNNPNYRCSDSDISDAGWDGLHSMSRSSFRVVTFTEGKDSVETGGERRTKHRGSGSAGYSYAGSRDSHDRLSDERLSDGRLSDGREPSISDFNNLLMDSQASIEQEGLMLSQSPNSPVRLRHQQPPHHVREGSFITHGSTQPEDGILPRDNSPSSPITGVDRVKSYERGRLHSAGSPEEALTIDTLQGRIMKMEAENVKLQHRCEGISALYKRVEVENQALEAKLGALDRKFRSSTQECDRLRRRNAKLEGRREETKKKIKEYKDKIKVLKNKAKRGYNSDSLDSTNSQHGYFYKSWSHPPKEKSIKINEGEDGSLSRLTVPGPEKANPKATNEPDTKTLEKQLNKLKAEKKKWIARTMKLAAEVELRKRKTAELMNYFQRGESFNGRWETAGSLRDDLGMYQFSPNPSDRNSASASSRLVAPSPSSNEKKLMVEGSGAAGGTSGGTTGGTTSATTSATTSGTTSGTTGDKKGDKKGDKTGLSTGSTGKTRKSGLAKDSLGAGVAGLSPGLKGVSGASKVGVERSLSWTMAPKPKSNPRSKLVANARKRPLRHLKTLSSIDLISSPSLVVQSKKAEISVPAGARLRRRPSALEQLFDKLVQKDITIENGPGKLSAGRSRYIRARSQPPAVASSTTLRSLLGLQAKSHSKTKTPPSKGTLRPQRPLPLPRHHRHLSQPPTHASKPARPSTNAPTRAVLGLGFPGKKASRPSAASPNSDGVAGQSKTPAERRNNVGSGTWPKTGFQDDQDRQNLDYKGSADPPRKQLKPSRPQPGQSVQGLPRTRRGSSKSMGAIIDNPNRQSFVNEMKNKLEMARIHARMALQEIMSVQMTKINPNKDEKHPAKPVSKSRTRTHRYTHSTKHYARGPPPVVSIIPDYATNTNPKASGSTRQSQPNDDGGEETGTCKICTFCQTPEHPGTCTVCKTCVMS
uniref:EF-hand domain-containing protein n=1 Tax=Amorphochlora amoebiformis TaxID=1561963 RepID=A0A7S0H333_9EUKA|mmetsp:Transcript_31730/g.51004  ORF Transcript_31730/g.51004 Transcript_31730/m.51004 type:complete len:1047 (+) Transcript_31730:73-3213(+)